jgi:hypothetical protein
MRTAISQTREVLTALQAAQVEITDLEVRTSKISTGVLQTTVRGFTRPMDGDQTVTDQVDRARAQIADTLGATFSAVDSNYGWVSVTTTATETD